MHDQIRVLFVAGTGRTGSTLIGNLLGSIDGAVSVGELRQIWKRGFGENWSCGCGELFHRCPFWQAVTTEAFGTRTQLELERLRDSERELLRLRNSWRWPGWVTDPNRVHSRHAHYTEMTSALYAAVAAVAESKMIIDSSKTPSYGAFLMTLPQVDLRLLHLIRDPRATAYSWLNPKPSPDRGSEGTMDRMGSRKSALLWAWWNDLASRLWPDGSEIPTIRVRYEEFTQNPEVCLRMIVGQLAPELSGRPFSVHGPRATIGLSHTVSGNPDRMALGPILIRTDERWKSELAPRDRGAVNILAGPVMRRLGYEKN